MDQNQKKQNLKDIRKYLSELIAKNKKFNLRSLSQALGRNDAYLQQYIKRGSPKYLPENDRLLLSKFLNIDFKNLTPFWLIINDVQNKEFIYINNKNYEKNNNLALSSDIFEEIEISNFKNLIFLKFDIFIDKKEKKNLKIILDKGINFFQEKNDYVLNDNDNFFIVQLSDDITKRNQLIVKPLSEEFQSFRILEKDVNIFGKVIFKSLVF